mgnify:CR=1 FL=1
MSAKVKTQQSRTQVEPRDSESLQSLIDVVLPKVLIEFGSWEGRSALAFVRRAKENSLSTKVICVDTWLGSPEHWRNSAPDSEWSFSHLNVVDGEPRVLDTFRQAIKDHHAEESISIVRATTSLASIYLSRMGERADLVYVDADHSYGAVLQDLHLAQRILGDDGVVAGDDWAWSSVRLAVSRYAGNRHTIWISSDGVTYALLRKNQSNLMSLFGDAGWEKVDRNRVFLEEAPQLARKYMWKPLSRMVDKMYIAVGLPRLSQLVREAAK